MIGIKLLEAFSWIARVATLPRKSIGRSFRQTDSRGKKHTHQSSIQRYPASTYRLQEASRLQDIRKFVEETICNPKERERKSAMDEEEEDGDGGVWHSTHI